MPGGGHVGGLLKIEDVAAYGVRGVDVEPTGDVVGNFGGQLVVARAGASGPPRLVSTSSTVPRRTWCVSVTTAGNWCG